MSILTLFWPAKDPPYCGPSPTGRRWRLRSWSTQARRWWQSLGEPSASSLDFLLYLCGTISAPWKALQLCYLRTVSTRGIPHTKINFAWNCIYLVVIGSEIPWHSLNMTNKSMLTLCQKFHKIYEWKLDRPTMRKITFYVSLVSFIKWSSLIKVKPGRDVSDLDRGNFAKQCVENWRRDCGIYWTMLRIISGTFKGHFVVIGHQLG